MNAEAAVRDRGCGCPGASGGGVTGAGAADSTISRLLHAVNRPAVPVEAGTGALTAEEQLLVDAADHCLRDGLSLVRWWQDADARGGYTERFELERTFNRSASSYAFF